MKKLSLAFLSLLLICLFCLGCKSVSVVPDASGLDLSTVVPDADNPNNYIDDVRYAPIPTDRGVFHIVREEHADYVSFLTDEGEEIRLLEGVRFANLQLVQPYLYAVDFGTRDLSDVHSSDYAKLYRMDLSDRSLSCFPRYTVSYYALSTGELLRVGYPPASNYDLILTDWENTNSRKLLSGQNPYNFLPQGDTVEWVYFDSSKDNPSEYDARLLRFSPERGAEEQTIWHNTRGIVWCEGIFSCNGRKYLLENVPDYSQSAEPHTVTVFALSEDGSRTALLETEYRRQSDDPALSILPERAAERIIEAVHPDVIIHEPLEDGLCLLGIASNHTVKIYVFDRLVSYIDTTSGVETLIPLSPAA